MKKEITIRIGFSSIVQITLIILKITGLIIWPLVLLPLIIGLGILIILFLIIFFMALSQIVI